MIEQLVKYQDRRCFVNETETWTYGQAMKRVVQIAERLSKAVTTGGDICVFMRHSIASVMCIMACIENGYNTYIIHPRSAAEMLENLAGLGVTFIVDKKTKEKLITTIKEDSIKIICYEDIDNFKADYDISKHRSKDGLAHIIIKTSGTTSMNVKFVQQPFNNLWIKSIMLSNMLKIEDNDINLLLSPLCFVQSFWTLLIHLIRGAAICVLPYKPHIMSEMFEMYNITTLITTPSVIRGAIEETKNPHKLRLLSIGGDYMEESLISKLEQYWPNVYYANVYGTTEGAAADVVFEPTLFKDNSEKMLSVGKESWYSKVFILREDGTIADDNEEGIICVESPMLQPYYYKSDIRMRTEQGYYKTYDIGYRDQDGYIYYRGRNAQIIVCNGEKISAYEIEQIIYEIGGVKEVVVMGINHNIYGQIPVCYVVVNEGVSEEITEEKIYSYLEERVEKHKIPRQINFVPKLDKTISDKIIRVNELYH